MPWTAADAESHHKGLSPHQASVWARVANEVLDRTGDEGRAIRAANAAVNRMREGAEGQVAFDIAVAEATAEAKMDDKSWTR